MKPKKIINIPFTIPVLGDTVTVSKQMPPGYKTLIGFAVQNTRQYLLQAELSLSLDGDTSFIEGGTLAGFFQTIDLNKIFPIGKKFTNDTAKIEFKVKDLGLASSYPYYGQFILEVEE